MTNEDIGIAHTLPGRTFNRQPKPVNKCAQFCVAGQVGHEKGPTARLTNEEWCYING